MTADRPPAGDARLQALFTETGLPAGPATLEALEELRALGSGPVPEPAAELARLIAAGGSPGRPRRNRFRGPIIGGTLAVSMGLGMSGVAAGTGTFTDSLGSAIHSIVDGSGPQGSGPGQAAHTESSTEDPTAPVRRPPVQAGGGPGQLETGQLETGQLGIEELGIEEPDSGSSVLIPAPGGVGAGTDGGMIGGGVDLEGGTRSKDNARIANGVGIPSLRDPWSPVAGEAPAQPTTRPLPPQTADRPAGRGPGHAETPAGGPSGPDRTAKKHPADSPPQPGRLDPAPLPASRPGSPDLLPARQMGRASDPVAAQPPPPRDAVSPDPQPADASRRVVPAPVTPVPSPGAEPGAPAAGLPAGGQAGTEQSRTPAPRPESSALKDPQPASAVTTSPEAAAPQKQGPGSSPPGK